MLFHEIFPFHDTVQPSADLVDGNKDDISIVLHSRHIKVRQFTGRRLGNTRRTCPAISYGSSEASPSYLSLPFFFILHGSTDVSEETHCIQDIIKQHETIGTNLDNCKIYLMSDRQATLEGLELWITQHTKCSPVIAKHDAEKGRFYEHGPFAVKTFFQDLAFAAHTNGCFIGALADLFIF